MWDEEINVSLQTGQSAGMEHTIDRHLGQQYPDDSNRRP